MQTQRRVSVAIYATALVAGLATAAAFLLRPPTFDSSWFAAIGTLYGLGLLSAVLAIPVTEHGVTSSTLYVPYLASILLVGPAGALTLTAATHVTDQFLIERKPPEKALFNTAQNLLAVAGASAVFVLLGAEANLNQIQLSKSGIPFLAGAAVYFLTNRVAVSFIMSVSEAGGVREMWRRILGNVILFDIAVSPVAYLVGFLYVELRAPGVLLGAIPVVGLRFIYGANIKLRELNRDLLRVLIRTLEAQDPYTSGHSVRVAERSKIIGQELGLSPTKIHQIETAALLHDIGKIDKAYHDILRQDGPLTDEQKELIREHPERGVSIIESVRSLDPDVLSFVRHHHERFDGNGYPDGLAGTEIPLGARIIMVSDTIDAMMRARPYRDAVPLPEIKKELIRCKNTQFDPDVVDAAIRVGLLDAESEIQTEIQKAEMSLGVTAS